MAEAPSSASVASKFALEGAQEEEDTMFMSTQQHARLRAHVRMPLAIGLLVVAQACTQAAASQGPPPERLEVPAIRASLVTMQVAPKDTDTSVTGWPNKHLVAFDPAVKPRNQLFLFLVGTGADPTMYSSAIVKQAAANGFDAISLSYPNTFSPSLCNTNPNPSCWQNVRGQILNGGSADPRAAVSPSDSLDNRLVKLLGYLDVHDASRRWSRYLDGATPRWSMIRIAGHSQGASLAAFIAIRNQVDRVTLFAGPTDVSPNGATPRPPFWVVADGATPSSRYFAFKHLRDETGVNFFATWTLLGLKGADDPFLIDGASTSFGHSHVVVTNAAAAEITPRPGPETTLPFHLIVAGSRLLPLTPAGQPLFAPAWQYLCFS